MIHCTEHEPKPTVPGPPGLPNGARVILAPLCGISTSVFRRMCLAQGAEMVVTEMISSEAMTRGKEAYCRALRGLDAREGPMSVQIFGADPDRMAETALRLSEARPEYLDMNFGCPVKKIVTRSGGSAVLKDLALLGRICRKVARACDRAGIPASAKIRAGWDKPSGALIRDIVRTIEDAGVSMIAVHARTRKQGFSGAANWELIAAAKEAVSIPVVGNGDVRSAGDAARMQEMTKCDAVMIGRAAIGNPWVFQEVRAAMSGETFIPPTPRERVMVLLDHVREAARVDGVPGGIIATRKVMGAYLKDLPGAREVRGKIMQITSVSELEDTLNRYLVDNAL